MSGAPATRRQAFILAVVVPLLPVALMLAGDAPRSEPKSACMDLATREQVQNIMIKAMDKALEEHLLKLFDVWAKDYSDEPPRAIKGAQNGINAYVRARAAALKWSPPAC